MVINDDITKKYLYYHLKKSDVFGEWTKLISTGTQANLNSEKVKSFGIFIPKNKSEQSKISSLFTHLDSLITLHQRKAFKPWKISKVDCLTECFVMKNLNFQA
ncbi:restriction endonuclease subunit S [Mycoplasmopsis bovis]|nr:restriction endonuclease subunit S [Mycoplasmopsis bovis]